MYIISTKIEVFLWALGKPVHYIYETIVLYEIPSSKTWVSQWIYDLVHSDICIKVFFCFFVLFLTVFIINFVSDLIKIKTFIDILSTFDIIHHISIQWFILCVLLLTLIVSSNSLRLKKKIRNSFILSVNIRIAIMFVKNM